MGTDSLTFSLRFGIGHFWGPWIVKPEEVAKIKATDSRFFMVIGVEFHLVDGRLWTFWTFNPERFCIASVSLVTRNVAAN
jgi:hypothetical protein